MSETVHSGPGEGLPTSPPLHLLLTAGGQPRRRRLDAPSASRSPSWSPPSSIWIGDQGRRRLQAVRHGHAQRPDAVGALLRRRQRLHADLRPDARREHGARLAVPAGRLPRAELPAEAVREGRRRAGPQPQRGGGGGGGEYNLIGWIVPLADGGADHRHPRRRDPAGLPALEPGPGPAPGADHDRDLGDRRRPDAGRLRRHREGHQGAVGVPAERDPARRRPLRLLPARDRRRLGAADRRSGCGC